MPTDDLVRETSSSHFNVHFLIAEKNAREVHHFRQAQHPRMGHHLPDVLRAEFCPRILERRGWHAARRHEEAIQRKALAGLQHQFDAANAEHVADLVRIGESVPVLVDALNGEEITGTVTWISSEAEFTPKNAQTRDAREQLVYAVKLRIENPEGRLHIGMPAEAIISR